MKFKAGDRVRAIGGIVDGEPGTIAKVARGRGDTLYAVEFDKKNILGLSTDGWLWCYRKHIELIEENGDEIQGRG